MPRQIPIGRHKKMNVQVATLCWTESLSPEMPESGYLLDSLQDENEVHRQQSASGDSDSIGR